MAVSLHGNNGLVTTNGTAAAPSLAAPDTDTGLYFGTNLIHATTNGTARLSIIANGKVGIGTTAPTEKLEVLGTTNLFGSGAASCQWGDTDYVGHLSYASDGAIIRSASGKALIFQTNHDTSNERLRITSGGNVQIANDSGKFELGADQDISFYHTGTHGFLENDTGTFYIKSDTISLNKENGNNVMWTNGSEMRIYPQDVGFGGAVPGGTPAGKNVFLAIGDSDTGIVQDGDGQLEIWGNAVEVANFNAIDGYTSTKLITTSNNMTMGGRLIHHGDTDTYMEYTDNQIDFVTGGSSRMYATNSAVYVRSGLPLAFLASSGATPNIKSGGTNNQDLLFTTGSGNPTRLQIKSGGEVRIGDNSTTASTAGDDLVIEGSSDRGLSIISGNNSSSNIYLGRANDADVCRIVYQHNDNALDFSVNAASTVLRMQSDGNMRWYPDGGSTGVNFYMSSNGASGLIFAANKDGSTGTSLHFKNQNSSGQARTWMEVDDSQRVQIPYGMGGTDKLNIYVGADVTKGINIMGQDGANQNSDSGRIHFNGYAQTNGPWIWGENVLAYGKKDLVFGTVSTANDYTTEMGETMRMLYYGSMQGGVSPDATLWDSGNQMGWHYNRSQGSFQMATYANTGYASWYINKNTGQGGSQDTRWIDFYWNSNHYGRIEYNGASGTNYNTGSDYRLKENEVPITDGIAKVKQLKPYRFNFKADTTDKVVQGFFAHEAQDIVPYAVSGTKDGTKVDERGAEVPDYQQVDYAKFTPILTAALKEAISKIEVLEAKVAALESS